MENNTPPMSAMAFTASPSTGKKGKKAAVKTKTVKASSDSAESTSEMFVQPYEELSNPEGYLYFSPF